MKADRIIHRSQAPTRPCSFAQQRLWLVDQLDPGSHAYNLSMAYRLTGELDVQVLGRCFPEIVRRHESLRTTFELIGERLVQRVHPPADAVLTYADCSGVPIEQRERAGRTRITEENDRLFDLQRGPLFRALLVRLDDREHILCVSVHHIAFDGWSWGVLWRELEALYTAFLAGQPSPLVEPGVQYADFAAWQAERLQGGELERQLAYWKEQLRGPLPDLHLPTDRPRPSIQTSRGARATALIPGELRDGIKALGRRERATLFMTLLGAFFTLLHRYSGDEDLLLGSPIAGRTHLETESLIGFFVNTLVLRGSLTGKSRFIDLLAQCRGVAQDAYANQEVPFDKLVEELQPERTMSRTPMFQVMLILQNTPQMSPRLTGVTATRIDLDAASTKFDLTLSMTERPNGLNAAIEYSTDLFDALTIDRMLAHFQTLLRGIVANPMERLSRLPLLTDAERRRMVAVWNDTTRHHPLDRTLPEMFEAQVARTPQAVALRDGERRATFSELNASANRLSHHLRRRGLGRGTFVGVCMSRSVELTVAVLGILKAGSAYVPFDPAHPAARLAFMIGDADVPLVLTNGDVTALPADVLDLTRDADLLAKESDENPGLSSMPEDPAYLMYTSGSTGTPKGVISPHRATVNRLCWMWDAYPFKSGEVCCQKTSPSFVDSIWETFGPLLQGIPSVIVSDSTAKDIPQLVEHLAQRGVSRIVVVPSLLRHILDYSDRLGELLPLLTCWVSSGEPLPPRLAARFRDVLPRALLLNLYGSTETAGDATCYEVTQSGPVRVGRPIDNLRVYILDGERQLVPIGILGRLYVGGAGLAVGYLNRPELTEEKFVSDPFGVNCNDRLYDTGDLGRYLSDGTIELCGRTDDQIKLRGMRLVLGEIDVCLRAHPSVTDAVVTVWGDADDQRLVAYVATSYAIAVSRLREHVAESLPGYMVPSTFVVLTDLPRTVHGKVDRTALPEPDWSQVGAHAVPIAAQTPMERAIADIWSEVLHVKVPSTVDSFFDLGGHSLLAMQVTSRMRERFGTDVPLRLLFEYPTIQELAVALGSHLGPADPGRASAPNQQPAYRDLPCG
jgi:amino acid adenylation domain-containing protein